MHDTLRKNLGFYIISVYFLIMFVLQIGIAVVIQGTGITISEDQLIYFQMWTNVIIYSTIFIIYLLTLRGLWKHQLTSFKQHFSRFMLYIAIGFGAIMATSVLVSILYQLMGVTDTSQNQQVWNEIASLGFVGMFSLLGISVFMAPLVEELVFRYAGFRILNRLVPNMPSWVVIVITSFLFGFIHVTGDDFVQVIYYMALGALLGFSYFKSKNILVPIGIHLAWNLFVTLSMFLIA